MKKALCVVVLVCGCGLAVSLVRANTPSTISAPSVVARGRFLNRTTPIPQSSIYMPVDNGLYRISAYATITVPSSNGTSFWSFNTEWTDDSGYAYNGGGNQLLASQNNDAGAAFAWNNEISQGATLVLQAKGGTPISISTTLTGPPDNSAYSLYYTLERLQ